MNPIITFPDEHNEEWQFSLDAILVDLSGEKTARNGYYKNRKYAKDVITTRLKNRSPIISFKDTGDEILYNAWYAKKKKYMENGKLR